MDAVIHNFESSKCSLLFIHCWLRAKNNSHFTLKSSTATLRGRVKSLNTDNLGGTKEALRGGRELIPPPFLRYWYTNWVNLCVHSKFFYYLVFLVHFFILQRCNTKKERKRKFDRTSQFYTKITQYHSFFHRGLGLLR